MKKFNILKIVEILISILTAGKAIHEEFKPNNNALSREGSDGEALDPIDNTDPQNPSYPPKK